METTEKTEHKSLGRYLAESKHQAQEEMRERYQNDPEFRAALDSLRERGPEVVRHERKPVTYTPEERARQERAVAFFEKLLELQNETIAEMKEAAQNDPRVREIIAELLHQNALHRAV